MHSLDILLFLFGTSLFSMSSSNRWPAHRFLRRQVRWSGIPISLRIFHCLLWFTQSNVASPQIHMLKSNPQGDGTWRWGFWEVIGSWVWSLYEWDYHSYKKGSRKLSHPFCQVQLQTTVLYKQGSHQTLNLPAPWSWTSHKPTQCIVFW